MWVILMSTMDCMRVDFYLHCGVVLFELHLIAFDLYLRFALVGLDYTGYCVGCVLFVIFGFDISLICFRYLLVWFVTFRLFVDLLIDGF